MPERGNRSRPDTDRVATVLGLALAVAMVSTVAVPGLATGRIETTHFNPNGGGAEDGLCYFNTDSAPTPHWVPVSVDRVTASVCVYEVNVNGCEVKPVGVIEGNTPAGYIWRYWVWINRNRVGFDVNSDRGPVRDRSDFTRTTIDIGSQMKVRTALYASNVTGLWSAQTTRYQTCPPS